MWTFEAVWQACYDNADLWWMVFDVVSIGMCFVPGPGFMLGSLLRLGVKAALKAAVRSSAGMLSRKAAQWAAKQSLRAVGRQIARKAAGNVATGVLVATVACLINIGGGGGGPAHMPAPSSEAMASATPEVITVSWDAGRLEQEQWHLRLSDRDEPLTALSSELFFTIVERELKALAAGGCRELVIDKSAYPGVDVVRRLRQICHRQGIEVSEKGGGDDAAPGS